MEYNLGTAIEQMKQKQESGLNYIYAKTYNYVYLRAKNIIKRENDVQQLMKEVYLKMVESANEIQVENLYEWVGKTVYQLGCKYYRKKKAREVAFLEMDKNEFMPRKSVSLDETTYVIQKRLEELPDLYQATFYAFYYDYMPVEEIAEVMECTTGIIINRLNYTRKYMIKALEEYQEEKKVKVAYSIEAVCLALRKWSIDHCLGITTAQSVYSEICKELKLQASPVYLEGKEFAGVNNTVVYHKQDDYEFIQSQYDAYGKKEPGVNPKVIRIAAMVIAAVVILGLAIILVTSLGKNKGKEDSGEDADRVEQQQNDGDVNDSVENQEDQSQDVQEQDTQDQDAQDQDTQSQDETQIEGAADSEYILPESNTQLLTEADLSGLSKEQLRIARNEMFARYGMIFGVEDLDSYFSSKSWYEPKYSSEDFYDYVEMSMTEEKNLILIQDMENR